MSQASSSSATADAAFLSVRIVTMDHYMAPPVPDLDPTFSASRSHAVRRVPVLRLYGPTPAGQKACLHLHGIFPYLYVPVPDPCPQGYSFRLATSLDRALNMALDQGESVKHVFKVQEVSGIPFYGYHPRQHRFFKIYFYNPSVVKKAADLLQGGGVMGARLQPHEAHVPYTLQFMMDYNLQGMNFIHLAGAKFRRRALSDEEMMEKLKRAPSSSSSADVTIGVSLMSQPGDRWLDPRRLPPASERTFDVDDMPESLLMPEKVEPVASTRLEADGVAADILNSNDGDSVAGMNPGLKALWEDERARRKAAGLEHERLTPPDSPPRPETANEPTDSEKFWKQRLAEKLERVRRENPELFDAPSSSSMDARPATSSDPDATCNFLVDQQAGADGEKELVYPAETDESMSLPSATEIHSHVNALAETLFEEAGASSQRSDLLSRRRSSAADSPSILEDVPSAAGASSLLDETIVDEEVVISQSMSLPKETEAADEVDIFAEDDEDLVELLVELGKRAEGVGRSGSQKSSSQGTDVFSSQKSREREAEEEAVSLEMSQLWFGEEEGEGDGDGDGPKGEKEKNSADADDVWGSDDDEQFWTDVSKKNLSQLCDYVSIMIHPPSNWSEYLGYAAALYLAHKFLTSFFGFVYSKVLASPLDVRKLGEWAVVTGSTDGIGKAYALELAKRGCNVVLVSRSPYKLQNVAAEIESKYKVKTKIVDIDFTSSDSEYVPRLKEELAGLEIGTLVNNVGMGYGHPQEFLELEDGQEMTRRLVDVNIVSTTSLTRLVLPQMVSRKKGAIINISSMSAMIPAPLLTVYAATKAFVDNFSVNLDLEYRRKGITVQSILPGYVVSKLSKVKESISAPNPDVFVRSALDRLGISSRSTGFWAHDLMEYALNCLPAGIAQKIVYDMVSGIRAKALRRIAREQASKDKDQ